VFVQFVKLTFFAEFSLSRACDTSHYPKDVPFEVPEGWAWCYLSDVGKWQSGSTPSRGVSAYYGGAIPWLKTGDLNDGYITSIPEFITEKALEETSVKLNPTGSVLIAMYGATIGKVGILTFPATTNQACCACSEFNGVYNKYLFYFLISHKDDFIRKAGGGAQPNISKEIIVTTPIPIPPAKEQERIVHAIENWLGIIDGIDSSQQGLMSKIADSKTKILDLAIHGKLVPQNPSDEPAIELLKRINPGFQPSHNLHYEGVIPDGWQICRLSDLFKVTMGQSPDGTSLNRSTGIEFHQGKICFTEKYLSESDIFTTSATKCAEPNSLLCCVRAPVGVFNITSRRICIGRGLCSLSPLDADVDIEYWFYALSSLTEYYESMATGSTFKAISGDIIRNTVIAVPPRMEQKRIFEQITRLFSVLKEFSDTI
jgi:type I restriction enzyme S subunit